MTTWKKRLNGFVDPQRLAIMAGVMTLHDPWAITRTKRFKAAGIGAGITNTVGMYGTQASPVWSKTTSEVRLEEACHLREKFAAGIRYQGENAYADSTRRSRSAGAQSAGVTNTTGA